LAQERQGFAPSAAKAAEQQAARRSVKILFIP